MKKVLFVGLIGLGLLTSCTSENSQEPKESVPAPFCIYSYDENSSEFEWEAYKTENKVAVAGGFNVISVESDSSEDPIQMIQSIKFEMEASSVESNDETRNNNIKDYFFKTINTAKIVGHFVSIDENGKAKIAVTMNGIEFEFEGDYQYENDLFSFKTVVDMASWNALSGIEALNEQCHDLHMGADGNSKLWSEIALRFKTRIKKECK